MNTISRIAKYITLAIIGVNTTFFAMFFFGWLKWFTFVAIDLIINGWCVFLMYSTNTKLFNIFCGFCHKLTGYCFYRIIKCTKLQNNDDKDKASESQFLEVCGYEMTNIPSQTNTDTQQNIESNDDEDEDGVDVKNDTERADIIDIK